MSRSKFFIPETIPVSVEDDGNILSDSSLYEYLPQDSLSQYLADPNFGEFPFDGEIAQNDLFASINVTNDFQDTALSYGQLPQTVAPSFFDPQSRFEEILAPVETQASKKRRSKENIIKLSGSVGVGQSQSTHRPSQSTKISLIHELEETYRPRYKSDYFAQNGTIRKPRYVADRKGNHFILLRVPTDVYGCIRIDWLTVPNEDGEQFSMPYRFQASNEKNLQPDQNPLYVPIEADSKGFMKVYLVLIKAKQDELKNSQPFKPFQPFRQAFGLDVDTTQDHSTKLMPKKLIEKFQLEKSQLAFTFCSPSKDGNSWIPEWNTMVLSTVMTEISPDTAARQKNVSCPKCFHSFPVVITPIDEDTTSETELVVGKRKRKQTTGTKKQKNIEDILFPMS